MRIKNKKALLVVFLGSCLFLGTPHSAETRLIRVLSPKLGQNQLEGEVEFQWERQEGRQDEIRLRNEKDGTLQILTGDSPQSHQFAPGLYKWVIVGEESGKPVARSLQGRLFISSQGTSKIEEFKKNREYIKEDLFQIKTPRSGERFTLKELKTTMIEFIWDRADSKLEEPNVLLIHKKGEKDLEAVDIASGRTEIVLKMPAGEYRFQLAKADKNNLESYELRSMPQLFSVIPEENLK